MPRNPNFDPLDPSTFGTKEGGLPSKRYSYQVQVDLTDRFNQSKTIFITIRSNDLLTEEELIKRSEGIVLSSQNQRYAGTIDNISVTGALVSEL